MARINLLPWREWERERRRKSFLVSLGLVLAAAALLVLGWGWQLDSSSDNQIKRNQFLEQKIAVLDEKIAEIKNLRQQRDALLERMRVIQELQGNRPVIVRIFDEIVRTLSSGVHFLELEMAGNQLTLTGVAESNNRISALMRNLDGSDWFAQPNLKSITEDEKNTDYGAQASSFELSFVQTNPKDPKDKLQEGK